MHRPFTTSGRAVGYARVSTLEQTKGDSVASQRERIAAQAAALGLTLVDADVFSDDGLSGGSQLTKRPGLWSALNALKKGDTLIVRDRSRLWRDAAQMRLLELQLFAAGQRLYLLDAPNHDDPNDPFARLATGTSDLYDEMHRLRSAALTKAAMARKRMAGVRISHQPPLGHRFTKARGSQPARVVADPREQKLIAAVRALDALGLKNRQIMARLNADGYRTRNDREWTDRSIHHLLKVVRAQKAGAA